MSLQLSDVPLHVIVIKHHVEKAVVEDIAAPEETAQTQSQTQSERRAEILVIKRYNIPQGPNPTT